MSDKLSISNTIYQMYLEYFFKKEFSNLFKIHFKSILPKTGVFEDLAKTCDYWDLHL